tara:strand:+ start:136 stop:609 length:474 start_codon:yes stop_codon:yes gene_type:complete
MGTFTAQVLIGREHPYHGGINPSHQLFLSENNRPAWILKSFEENDEKTVWIPTLEHMFEDALLMIGIYILKDKKLIELFRKYRKSKNDSDMNLVELYDDIDSKDLDKLYEQGKKMKTDYKLIFSIFEESSIKNVDNVLKDYNFKFEVLKNKGNIRDN